MGAINRLMSDSGSRSRLAKNGKVRVRLNRSNSQNSISGPLYNGPQEPGSSPSDGSFTQPATFFPKAKKMKPKQKPNLRIVLCSAEIGDEDNDHELVPPPKVKDVSQRPLSPFPDVSRPVSAMSGQSFASSAPGVTEFARQQSFAIPSPEVKVKEITIERPRNRDRASPAIKTPNYFDHKNTAQKQPQSAVSRSPKDARAPHPDSELATGKHDSLDPLRQDDSSSKSDGSSRPAARPTPKPRTPVSATRQKSFESVQSPAMSSKRAGSAASFAHRPTDAAVHDAHPPTATPGLSHGSRSPRSALTTSSWEPAKFSFSPVDTLRELSLQSEALHVRYEALRTERREISSGIVSNIKNQKQKQDHVSTWLDEQLALAAVSTSMDICYAKLKSLDCRKEEAIAALIAQTRTSSYSSSVAPSRKASIVSSTSADSEGQYVSSERLTSKFSAGRRESSSRTQGHIREPSKQATRSRSSTLSNTLSCLSSSRPIDRNEADTASNAQIPLSRKPVPPVALSSRDGQTHKLPARIDSLRPIEKSCHSSPSDSPDPMEAVTQELLRSRKKSIRVQGMQAAKLLGLLAHPSGDRNSAVPRIPNEFNDLIWRKQPELELELTTPTSQHMSSSNSNLEFQLKSFPKPLPPLPGDGEDDDPISLKRETRGVSLGAQTIQVYMDDEILQYYKDLQASRGAGSL